MNPVVRCVVGGPLDVNTYVVALPQASECVVIDPGAEIDRILGAIDGRKVSAVLLTHAHFDHMLSAEPLLKAGAKLYVHEADEHALSDERFNMSGVIEKKLALPGADVLLREGDTVSEAGMQFTVLHTPGHTKGSVCYLTENILFSGDTLFFHTCGRTDLPGGSMNEMVDSLRRLMTLPKETIVYPGHGDRTKIGWERGSVL